MSKADASIDYSHSSDTAAAVRISEHADPPPATSVIYNNAIPQFAAEAIDKHHASIYATLDHLRIEGELDNASTYVCRQRGDIKGILLFRREQGVAVVLNQLFSMDGNELQRFAGTLFENDPSLSAISLTAIQTNTHSLCYPYQRHRFTEDIVAALPPSADDFLSRLGKNTRETVKRYTGKVQRTFPSFRFEVYTDNEISGGHARELYGLHQARMLAKNDHSDVDEREFSNIVELARRRGVMTVATIDGRVCGGLICWRVGHHYFMRIIAHDPQYDDVKLGTVCCYLTMRECIARKGASFHFLFGRMPYKYRFLGEGRVFDQVVIYRSWLAMARQSRMAIRTASSGANRDLRLWLLDAASKDDWISRTAMSALRAWRMARDFRGKSP